ncbi:MAG: hypothetical protein H6623_02335 [Bdellovibrionaceae bacterium]|nr:hypothetical protein [Pseudobdellovibrionaceae bacterium]
MLNALLLSVVYVLIFVLQKRQESLFRYGFPEFLTSIILQMKIGKSFRSSFQFSLENLPTYQKEILSKIYQNVVFLPQANDKKMTFHRSFSGILLHELRKIDQSTHQTIDKIENFRTRLITANNFRRRSGRIRENIYVQLGFMSFIYVSAFAYIAWTMPVSLIGDILIVSLAFFLLGGTIALFIGRKIKWTI